MSFEIIVTPLVFPIPESSLSKDLINQVPSSLQVAFQGLDPHGITSAKMIALSAKDDKETVGLLFASMFIPLGQAVIHGVFSISKNKDVIRKLLIEAVTICTNKKITFISYILEENHPFEPILKDLNWQGPMPAFIECHFIAKDFTPKWLYKKISLPEGFTYKHWNQLSVKQIEKLQGQINNEEIPYSISPFGGNIEAIVAENSLFLCHKNEIIGWSITKKLSKEDLRYDSLFLKKQYLPTGLWLDLLNRTIIFHQNEIKEALLGTIFLNIDLIPSSWRFFVKRHLLPYALKIKYLNHFWKT